MHAQLQCEDLPSRNSDSSPGTSCGTQEVRFESLDGWWDEVRAVKPFFFVEDTQGIVAARGDKLLAAAIFNNVTTSGAECHQILLDPMVLRRGWFSLVYHYASRVLGLRCLHARVPSDNEKALRLNRKLGFKDMCRLTDAHAPGVDYVVQELKDEDYRYGR